ncbi:UDP-glucoronosyl and UDP-glucosyl transferase [Ancylostoma ceylanicum]|uniref:UDP-glucuronosyltransferase n=1 Tax=Ancylostoma ceylanicum TaxID=53326 RepID=A0A0D6MAE0_9BILA|nr:UDP-glucoronosyl and UDP-glucosyl transferase [Ancylostoma ceylanicum]
MFIILLLTLLTRTCDSYKILVVSPKYGYSHMNFMGKIADTLVDAGHDVVTLQPIVDGKLVGTGTSKSRLIQIQPIQQLKEEIEMFSSPESVLSEKKIMQQLRDEKFDLAITELFEFIGIAVIEALGIKNVVGAHSNGCILEGTAQAIGLPLIPSYMPAANGVTDDSTDISTRATNLLFTVLSVYMHRSLAAAAEQAMIENLGPTITPLWARDSFEYELDSRELRAEWEDVLSLRQKTILISLGSVIPSVLMPEGMKKTIIEVVKSCIPENSELALSLQRPVIRLTRLTEAIFYDSFCISRLITKQRYPNITFIWKYEKPDDPYVSGVQNLVLSKWTPQNDLLADDRITAFVTHGGSGSMMESAVHGKPLIVIPLFGDQTRNAKTVVKYGFGIHLEKSKLLRRDAFRDAIENVLEDNK